MTQIITRDSVLRRAQRHVVEGPSVALPGSRWLRGPAVGLPDEPCVVWAVPPQNSLTPYRLATRQYRAAVEAGEIVEISPDFDYVEHDDLPVEELFLAPGLTAIGARTGVGKTTFADRLVAGYGAVRWNIGERGSDAPGTPTDYAQLNERIIDSPERLHVIDSITNLLVTLGGAAGSSGLAQMVSAVASAMSQAFAGTDKVVLAFFGEVLTKDAALTERAVVRMFTNRGIGGYVMERPGDATEYVFHGIGGYGRHRMGTLEDNNTNLAIGGVGPMPFH